MKIIMRYRKNFRKKKPRCREHRGWNVIKFISNK